MRNLSRILIANRGEIAVRVIKACRALGIETVSVVSDADRESLPGRMADRCICIGPAPASESYLNINLLLAAAIGTGARAIHPGYGFLAEKPELAEACQKYGIKFIGPSAQNIREMGNKVLARTIVAESGIPIIPGTEDARDVKQALRESEELGFPVLLKAAAGGGGRGMKIVYCADDLVASFDSLSSEVRSAFGDGTLFIERYIPNARHVEVQILADSFGNIVQLGERDCSVQRRHQKLIEESPPVAVSEGLRWQMTEAALAISKRIGYESVGTVEFLVDLDTQNFYFLEMNTRIQVEHPVTEAVTGVDLVQEQIRVADGQPLRISQGDIRPSGHAIECRINAESPLSGFQPCPGRIDQWEVPEGEGIRIDTHCYPGYIVSPYYDSLLCKVISWGKDRGQAIERMSSALGCFRISGLTTTLHFHKTILESDDFIQQNINTRWVETVVIPQMGGAGWVR